MNGDINTRDIPIRYPHDFKRKVVLYAERFSNREAERKFGISESNIRRWKKLRPILFSKAFVSENGRRKRLVKRASNANTDFMFEIENVVDENDKIIEMPRLVKQVSRQPTPTIMAANPATTATPATIAPPANLANSSLHGDGAFQEPEGEEVCIRWNSHHSNMKSAFPYLLQREQYVDVTLTSDGKSLKCHKLILSSCSGYFDELLTGIEPYQHPVIFLNGVPFWLLKAILDFMYAGEVHIDQNKLPQLLKVAQMLQIKGLTGKESKPEGEEVPPPQLEKNETAVPPPKAMPEIKPPTPKIPEPKPKIPEPKPKIPEPKPATPKPTEPRPILPKPAEIKPIVIPITEKPPEVAQKTGAEIPRITKVTLPLNQDELPRLRVVHKKDVPFALKRRSIVFKAIPVMSSPVDPMSLLRTAFVEDVPDTSSRLPKESPRKVSSGKKYKKRKVSEYDLFQSPPTPVYRKGTKSRPNVKVPRYYHNDYDTVLKKKMLKRELKETLQKSKLEDTTFDLSNVKSEPLDIEDTDVQFMEITTDDIPEESDLSRDFEATSSSVDENLLSVTKDLFAESTERFFKIEPEPTNVTNGDKDDEEVLPEVTEESVDENKT